MSFFFSFRSCPHLSMKRLSIKEFYEGRSLFITGATGFLGKLLVEKLIRSCPGVGQIYLLTRSKQGQDVASRVTSLLKDPAFKRMPEMGHQKVVGIAGDLYQRGLGISPQDRERLCREVSVVFHVAASVKFDEDLKFILQTNVGSTQAIIDLCKDMSNLEVGYIGVTLIQYAYSSFTYVSTAYSNYPRKEVHEKVYSPPMDPHKIQREVAAMSQEELARKEKRSVYCILDACLERVGLDGICILDAIMRAIGVSSSLRPSSSRYFTVASEEEVTGIIKNWPNTYAFSKILAENVVLENSKIIPSCILRPAVGEVDNDFVKTTLITPDRDSNLDLPAIGSLVYSENSALDHEDTEAVTSSVEEPVPGWIDNQNGIIRTHVLSSQGRMRVANAHRKYNIELIPVDIVTNATIAAGWDTAYYKGDMKVFNVTTSVQNPIKYGEWIDKTKKYFHLSPPLKTVWYNSLIIVKNRGMFYTLWFTLDLVPAFIIDTLTLRKHKMVDYSTKSLSYNGLVSPFFIRSWKFCDKNVQNLLNSVSKEERREFNFDVTTVNWDTYAKSFVDGINTFLTREDPKKLPEARQRYKKLYLLHRLTQAGFTLLVSSVAWQVGVTALYS
uniref:Fatty acyl-CoA reductase n=1 Tax=Timema tahoe TaxID=61484 RepID=A0A7R9FJF0_9NEOP|nr:unnamed protein product [Timema tahoe]